MRLNSLRMGGASEGIIGVPGGDTDSANKVKRSALSFAKEYRKSKASRDELMRLELEIVGYLQILQLTYVLSETEADKLIDELQLLTDKASA